MATLKDVAELAGVSVSTVSYVLNGKKKVKPETLKRIQDAIERLNYYPNMQAASLKTNQSKIVGVVVSDMLNQFNVALLAAVEEELAVHGYSMLISNSNNDPEQEKKCIRRLMSQNIDGMLLFGMGMNDYSNMPELDVPLVCIDRRSGEKFCTVTSDNVKAGSIGADYLLTKKYHKILFLGCQNHLFSRERFQGFREVMAAAGRESDIIYRDLTEIEPDAAYCTVRQLIEEKVKFDAVYGCVDYYAIGAMKALVEKNIKIPQQVGVLGIDNIASCNYVTPSLTSIAQRKDEIGKIATKQLLKLIQKEKIESGVILVEPYLECRESC